MERRNFLRELSSFIAQTDQSLKFIAERLGWNAKKLSDEETLVCSYNSGHRVPIGRSEEHEERCRLRSIGIDPDVEMSVKLEGSEFFYKKSREVVTVKTGKRLRDEIIERSLQGRSSEGLTEGRGLVKSQAKVTDSMSSLQETALLESSVSRSADPLVEIRNISSWTRVPLSHVDLPVSEIEGNVVKAWIVDNLPAKHSKMFTASGEVDLINFIYLRLCSGPCQPDQLLAVLAQFFGAETRHFVLMLWKFLAEAFVLKSHQLSEQDIATVRILGKADMAARETSVEPDPSEWMASLAELSTNQQEADKEPAVSTHAVTFQLTVAERRALYDYAAEVTRSKRDHQSFDVMQLHSQAAQAQELVSSRLGGESTHQPSGYLDQMVQQRDYRRRRQSYRARNTHITKRTPTEVMRDLIEAHMDLLRTSMSGDERKRCKTDWCSQQQTDVHLTATLKEKEQRRGHSGHCSSQKRRKSSEQDIK